MNVDNVLRLLHTLALFMMAGGLLTVLLPLFRGWTMTSLERRIAAFEEADNAKIALLVPGTILVGITGFAWTLEQGYNFITTGWLLALTALYLLNAVICVPLMSLGLRRVQLLTLQAQKKETLTTPELEAALADNVPIVFGLVILATLPIMTLLPIFKPF